jgi:hypothetical protein
MNGIRCVVRLVRANRNDPRLVGTGGRWGSFRLGRRVRHLAKHAFAVSSSTAASAKG